jgi:predicted phosphodiesterase
MNTQRENDLWLYKISRPHSQRNGDRTWAQIIRENNLTMTVDGLRKKVRRAELRLERLGASPDNGNSTTAPTPAPLLPTAPDDNLPPAIAQAIQTINEFLSEKTEQKTQTKMYDPYPAGLHDLESFEEWKRSRVDDDTVIVFASDVHIPDHDKTAVSLAVEIMKAIQPNLICWGGDIFDLSQLSRFQEHPLRRKQDAFQEIREIWDGLIDRVCAVAPQAKQVFLEGNHEARRNKLPEINLYHSIENVFAELVRTGDRVWWLADTTRIWIGNLLLQHGKKTGLYTARKMLDDEGYATNVIQGHSHRPGLWFHRLTKAQQGVGMVTGLVSGCLCNIPPHYPGSNSQKWLHGVAVAHVRGNLVNVQMIPFHHEQGQMVAYYGSKQIKAGKENGHGRN